MTEIFKNIIELAKSGSAFKKVLLIIALAAFVGFLISSCSTHRQFNVSFDKADSVKINYTDSLSAVYPNF